MQASEGIIKFQNSDGWGNFTGTRWKVISAVFTTNHNLGQFFLMFRIQIYLYTVNKQNQLLKRVLDITNVLTTNYLRFG